MDRDTGLEVGEFQREIIEGGVYFGEQRAREGEGTYTFWDEAPRDLASTLWYDPTQMGGPSWRVDPQSFLNHGVQIYAVE